MAALVLAAPVLAGLGYVAAASVGLTGVGATGLTGDRIRTVLGEPAVWRGLSWSLWAAGASTLLATAAAVLIAALFRSSRRGDVVARALAILPLPVPHIVAATCAVLILGQSGVVARIAATAGWIHAPADMPALVYDRWGTGLILMLAWKEFPFLALIAISLLATRGRALEETARSLGARPGDVFRRVTWPLLWRGLAPAVVAVFTFVMGAYEGVALLAPSNPLALPLLTMERYTDAALGRRADAYVLALLGLGVSALAVGLHEWARGRWERLDT